MDRLISLEPSNLVAIRIEPGQKCYGVLTLRNVMYTMPVAFRIQAMNKTRYTIKPQSGIISPLATLTIEITYHLPPGSFLPDTFPHCEDAFLLHSGIKIMFVGSQVLAQLVADGAMDEIREVLERSDQAWNPADSVDSHGRTLLHIAIAQGRPDIVQLLLEFEPDVERQSRSGSTPLEAAAGAGEALIVELLLARRASAERSESSTWGPIHLAAGGGHLEVLRLLLLKGANVDALTKDGNTALHLAVEERRRDCARLLLASGAKADIRDTTDGDTPLHIAAKLGDESMIKLLLKKGANKDIRNKSGKTAYDVAAEYGHTRLFDSLKLGDSLCIAARKGEESGHADVIELLVKKGADVEARTNKGVTALQIAESLHYVGITRVLIHSGAAKDGVMQAAAPVHLPFGKSMSGTEVEKAIKKRPPRARALKGSFDRSMALAVL
ncbi:hypothetical protein GH714_004751 [Hevea brasiliensis]|uniref:MSP domain-containing protein n=1 Tax=Hevea brasiliensis TaxID=3981 RepID=A0A6A6KGZ0_HEVBR|nr:hypothetical protein GH714_004751 [Hevea brasiliensis]